MAQTPASLMIKTPTENEVLAKIEQINDSVTKNAVMALFFWRMATQTIVSNEPTLPSSQRSS